MATINFRDKSYVRVPRPRMIADISTDLKQLCSNVGSVTVDNQVRVIGTRRDELGIMTLIANPEDIKTRCTLNIKHLSLKDSDLDMLVRLAAQGAGSSNGGSA